MQETSGTEADRRIAAILLGMAQLYRSPLDDFAVKQYMEILGGYNPDIVELAVKDCIAELGFMPRPVEITNRIKKHEGIIFSNQTRREQQARLPEPEKTDEDRAFGSFVCKAMAGWMRSGFIKKQRDAGTFIDYEQSLFAYMDQENMDQKHIDRFKRSHPDS